MKKTSFFELFFGIKNIKTKNFFKSAFIVSIFVVVAKFFGLIKDSLLAYYYGAGHELDGYFFLFNLMMFVFISCSSFFEYFFVPRFLSLKYATTSERRIKIKRAIPIVVLFVIFFSVIFLLSILLIKFDFVSSPFNTKEYILSNFLYFFALVPLGIICYFFFSILISSKNYKIPIFEAIPAIIISIFLRLKFSSDPLLLGTLCGYLIFFIASLVSVLNIIHFSDIKIKLSSIKKLGNDISLNIFLFLVGNICINFVTLSDQFFIIKLNEGAFSEFLFASKLSSILLSVLGFGINRSAILELSKLKNLDELKSLCFMKVKLVLLISVVFSIILFLMSSEIVHFLFEHGKFSKENAENVSWYFSLNLIQVPVYLASLVMLAALAVTQHYLKFALIGFLGILIKLGFNYLTFSELGIIGIIISNILIVTFFAIASYYFLIQTNYFYSKDYYAK